MVSKYQREENARYDKLQYVFDPDLSVKPNQKPYAESWNPNQKYLCPFCLSVNSGSLFVFQDKKHYMLQCPNCKTKLLTTTLKEMLKMNSVSYAQWVFRYRIHGFWDKVKFNEWRFRLIQMGFSNDFWNEYYKLRGDRDET